MDNLIPASTIWRPMLFPGHCISSVAGEGQHVIIQTAWGNVKIETSTVTHTGVATTVGFPDLYLKWQLKIDGEASALSELSLHLSVTRGSDCHCYADHVHQKQQHRHPAHNGTYGWGGETVTHNHQYTALDRRIRCRGSRICQNNLTADRWLWATL